MSIHFEDAEVFELNVGGDDIAEVWFEDEKIWPDNPVPIFFLNPGGGCNQTGEAA